MMYRQLTSQERDLLCDAFQRFAKAKHDVALLEAASEQYRADLDAAGIVYTSQGFRVFTGRDKVFTGRAKEDNEAVSLCPGKPR